MLWGMNRLLRPQVLIEVMASAALIAVLLWRTDIEQAVDVAARGDYPYLAIALPLYLLANLLGAVRWRVSLHKLSQPPVLSLFGIFLAAGMANRILPMRLGDVLRVQVPAKRYGLQRATLTALIFVTETLLDGFALVFLFLMTLAFLGVPQLPLTLAWTLTVTVLVGSLVAVLAARLELDDGWQDRGWFRLVPGRIRGRAGGFVPRFLDGLAVLRDPYLSGYALGVTFAAWLVQAGMFFVFGLTFGLHLSLAEALIVTITSTMVISVPLLPFSFGTYEVAVTGVLVLMGYDDAESVTFALGSHLMVLAIAVAAGLPAMWRMDLGLHDILFFGGVNGAETTAHPVAR